MIASLALILLLQLAGEALARGLGLPVPGPVLGMAGLLVVLAWRGPADGAPGEPPRRLPRRLPRLLLPAALTDGTLEATGKGLLAHLSLLFVPAGVGVVGSLDVLARHGAALAAALVVSTVAALLATVATFLLVARRLRGPGDGGADAALDEASNATTNAGGGP